MITSMARSSTRCGRANRPRDTKLATVNAELSALERPATAYVAAGILYKTQDLAEQRRVVDSVLSNCTFDRGSVCRTDRKPFDLFARASETGEWRGRRDSNPRPLP